MQTETLEPTVKPKAITVDYLKSLGFTAAAEDIMQKRTMKRKLMLAYEHFRYIQPAQLKRFERELKERTFKTKNYTEVWQTLKHTPLASYKEVPPMEVLEKVKEAQDMGIFDEFKVITMVEQKKRVPDPLIYATINGCPDMFFVAQWDNDVKIEEILKEGEG